MPIDRDPFAAARLLTRRGFNLDKSFRLRYNSHKFSQKGSEPVADLCGEKSEKKVEYLELIYDLIFVYLIGRNNAILHHIEGGFFTGATFFTYLLSTLVILQIWYFSSLYINRYGTNSVRDHVFLFVNMYLLYYLADGTRTDWSGYYIRYNVAWGLILLNHAAQYLLQLLRGEHTPWEEAHLKNHLVLLILLALIVLGGIPLYQRTGLPLSWVSLVIGFAATAWTQHLDVLVPVNPEHLTERVMLFIVFTFGESIVGLATYFTGEFGLNTVYFSLAAFLIVAGLFVSYGFLYNRVIDRERNMVGNGYMLLHIVLIVALNNITVAMEFMREAEVGAVEKNVFIVASFLIYYLFMFFIGYFAKDELRAEPKFFLKLVGISAMFVIVMAATYRNGWISVAASVLYVYAMFGMIVLRWREVTRFARRSE